MYWIIVTCLFVTSCGAAEDFLGWKENSTEPEIFDDGVGPAANHTILELYKLLRNTENPSVKEVEAIKRSDTIRSYVGHIMDGHFYTEDSHKWRVVFPTFEEFNEEMILAEIHVDTGDASDHLVGLDSDYLLSLPCESTTPVAVCRRRMLSRAFDTTKYIYGKSADTIVIDFTEELRTWLMPGEAVKRMAELWSFKGTDEDLLGEDDFVREMEEAGSEHRRQMLKILSERAFQEASEEDGDGELNGLFNVNLVVYTRAMSNIVKDRLLTVRNRTSEEDEASRIRRSTSDEEAAVSERRKKKKEKQLRKERREEYMRARDEKLAQQQEEEMAAAEESIEVTWEEEDASTVEDLGPCRVVEMQVDFEEIGWSQWILFPKNFNAGRCTGRCAGPLDRIHNPNNHAVMQDLIRMKQPGRAPEPCCIPTRLQPLSMLYVENGAIVVRHHEDMLAEECGCR